MQSITYERLPTIPENDDERRESNPWPRTPYPFHGVLLNHQPDNSALGVKYDSACASDDSGSDTWTQSSASGYTKSYTSKDDVTADYPEVFALSPPLEHHGMSEHVSWPQQSWPSDGWDYEHPAVGHNTSSNSWNQAEYEPPISCGQADMMQQRQSCTTWLETVTDPLGDGQTRPFTAPRAESPDDCAEFNSLSGVALSGTVIPRECDLQDVGILPTIQEGAGATDPLKVLSLVASLQEPSIGSREEQSVWTKKRSNPERREERSNRTCKRPRLVRNDPVRESSWSIPVSGSPPPSPERCFTEVLAEKPTLEGTMYKVVWRESWIHESRMPPVEPLRELQFVRTGRYWDVLPMSPTIVYAA